MAGPAEIAVAVLQCAFDEDRAANIARVETLAREAAGQGASVILPPELFQGPYFPQTQDPSHFARARSLADDESVAAMARLAKALGVVIPVSFFEKDGPEYFNSLAMVDADGRVLGVYRKSHIPDGPGYQEKYHFRPGDTGFRVWETAAGRLGVGVCWDQWFPEAARAMALAGAEALLYPTAIGSEPQRPDVDTAARWRRAMQGHAVANVMPVAAANRIGREGELTFYGTSFIAGPDGAVVTELGRDEEGVALATFHRAALEQERADWGFFRDRRPDLY